MVTVKDNLKLGLPVPTTLALVAGCGLVLAAAPAQAAGRAHGSAIASRRVTPPDSYLQYRVYTVDQLIQQVTDSPRVRKRFARHFQIPEERVVSYMKANLVESYVPKTERYTVYCVRPTGRFYPIRQLFQRGTKVFALRNGEPVMKWLCGNPLTKFLPDVNIEKVASYPPEETPHTPAVVKVADLTESLNVLTPAEISAPVYQPIVPIGLGSAATPLYSRAGTSLLPFLLPVALLGINRGGGNTPTPIPAVPEAGSLVYLAAALPLALLVARRRRSKDAVTG